MAKRNTLADLASTVVARTRIARAELGKRGTVRCAVVNGVRYCETPRAASRRAKASTRTA